MSIHSFSVLKTLSKFKLESIYTPIFRRNLCSLNSSKDEEVRVRFAPSPTGFLHIGGLRTALYNYLFAKKHKKGKFILRIEDTDQARLVPGSIENLFSILEWSGIIADESPKHGGNFGPYRQSERLHYYKKYKNILLENGSAYRCFCSQLRLNILKKDQLRRKELPRYDNKCRNLTHEEVNNKLKSKVPYTIRLRLTEGEIQIKDELFGLISHNISYIEGDPILMKSDGYPTYHLANVVDDYLMKITHVIRGKEWLISTGKHVLIYKALSLKPPIFMHLPLLINKDGSKLSKRQGHVFVEEYKDQGYSPVMLLNFMAFYGGGFPGLNFPIKSVCENQMLQQLKLSFDPQKLLLSNAIVDFKKLDEFGTILTQNLIENGNHDNMLQVHIDHLRDLVFERYREKCIFHEEYFTPGKINNYIHGILNIRKKHVVKICDLTCVEFLWTILQYDPKSSDEEYILLLKDVINLLANENFSKFDIEKVGKYLKVLSKHYKLKFPQVMGFLRRCLSQKEEGPPLIDMIHMLQKEQTLKRFQSCLRALENFLKS